MVLKYLETNDFEALLPVLTTLLQFTPVEVSPLRIPVIGFTARGTQRLNCSMRGSMGRAKNNSAVECCVLETNYRNL